MKIFDTSFRDTDKVIRRNHGRPWEDVNLQRLRHLFNGGASLRELCEILARSPAGVLPKLVNLGLIRQHGIGGAYVYVEPGMVNTRSEPYPVDNPPDEQIGRTPGPWTSAVPPCQMFYTPAEERDDVVDAVRYAFQALTQPKEPIMAAANFEIKTKTLIQGVDASQMTDTQIFTKIHELETQIAALNQIEAKPQKLLAAVAELRADIKNLVDYVDNRS